MAYSFVCSLFFIVSCLAANGFVSATEVSIEQIWLAPVSYANNETVPEPFSAANRGVWFTSDIAIGSRLNGAVTMDSKKILWIFGGLKDQQTFTTGVWNYNVTSDQYRWLWKPANPDNPTAYNSGELGVESDLNSPGRLNSPHLVTDLNDNIWTFLETELWMFNTSSWNWVRIQGYRYGIENGATPGSIEYSNMFIDSRSDVWLVGGQRFTAATNEVWHFNMTSKLWRFVSNNKTSEHSYDNSTFTGGVIGAQCDIDEDDKVWCYGGISITSDGMYESADVWTYDTRADTWTHQFGNISLYFDVVANPNDYDPDNVPSSGRGNFVNRRDGTFMYIPGSGSDMIWLYNVTLNQWRLVYGNTSTRNTPGVYVTRREPGSTRPANNGFSLQSGLNFDGDVYLHGGSGSGNNAFIKDIWLIPQNQCLTTANKCDSNADCIDQLIGYSCQCRQGYQGDGFTCTLLTPTEKTPDRTTPASSTSPKSATSSVSRLISSVAWISLIAVMA